MTESKRHILFIINPISGVGKKNVIPPLIERYIDSAKFNWEIRYTEYRNHGFEIANIEKVNFDAIIAVGGDGSVNEIGRALIHTNCALGIIPSGSGNGIARHLDIPLNFSAAIRQINGFEPMRIDTGLVNKKVFIGICGFGLDAHIASKFEAHAKRGFLTYAKLVLKEFSSFKPQQFQIKIEDTIQKHNGILCTIANSSQFGNGFTISPKSDLQDGKFEIVFIEQFKVLKGFDLAYKFFTKSIHKSTKFKSLSFTDSIELNIENTEIIDYHIDGESNHSKGPFTIEIQPLSLSIL